MQFDPNVITLLPRGFQLAGSDGIPGAVLLCLLGLLGTVGMQAQETKNVTLAWDASPSTNVTGYLVYYAAQDGSTFRSIDVGRATTCIVSNLEAWVPYDLAVSAYSSNRNESDLAKLTYTPVGSTPPNAPPTLDPIADLVVPVNSGPVVVLLTGIGPGAFYEDQTVTLTATSSSPGIIPNPVISFDILSVFGLLTLKPVRDANGLVEINVRANDGASRSNLTTRSFRVRVGNPVLTNILMEAEGGQLTTPMTLVSDGSASGGASITTLTSGAGQAVYRFSVPQMDDYYVWCRVRSPDGGSDSFFVSVDNGAEDIFDTVPDNNWSTQYKWTLLNGRTNGNPRFLSLSHGAHSLTFRGRESRAQLDALYVSNDPRFVPVSLGIGAAGPTGAHELHFVSPPGHRYDVQASEDLTTWTTIWRTSVATTNQQLSYIDSVKPASGRRFYRLVIQ